MTAAPPHAIDMTDADVLGRALDRLPEFRGLPRSVTALEGGLTNRIYRVQASSGYTAVARLSSGKSALLAIDRNAECHNSRSAASAGAGPRVLLCEPSEQIAIVEWIEGRTFAAADLDDSRTLERFAALCRTLHTAPRFANEFDMVDIQRGYLNVVIEHGFRMPADYLDFAGPAARVAAALSVHPEPSVPCHNDLLPANVMDDGDRLWFIDYEYAGNNDPYFELGNAWAEANLDDGRLVELVTDYHGTHSDARIARARLYALLARYGWTLWAAIQAAVSDVEFDFWSWGLEKYERAVAEFTGPQFDRLLDDVTTAP